MRLEDFLDVNKLGNNFLAVGSYEPVSDHDTGKLSAYRLNVSIQSQDSPFFFEMIPVKVKTLTPTVTVEQLAKAKTTPVELQGLNMGQYNGTLWFNCTDVLPKK